MKNDVRHALVVGCGYLGRRIAGELLRKGYHVTATTRSDERISELRELGVDPIRLDLRDWNGGPTSGAYEVVIYCVSAGRQGDGQLCYLEGPLKIVESLQTSPPEKFLYISSTGVYAQNDGTEVDEESLALSQKGNHGWILGGEKALLTSKGPPRATVIRLGGLYGPGRSPVEWLRQEEFRRRLTGSGVAFMNWIHVDDAAMAIVAAEGRGQPGEIYLVVDGHPVRRREFYEYAARLGNVEPPLLTDSDEDLGKRCRNKKMIRQLGIALRYPDYRVGLVAC